MDDAVPLMLLDKAVKFVDDYPQCAVADTPKITRRNFVGNTDRRECRHQLMPHESFVIASRIRGGRKRHFLPRSKGLHGARLHRN
ncbi:hypothetical protein D3C73_1478970 [compost metagenome]